LTKIALGENTIAPANSTANPVGQEGKKIDKETGDDAAPTGKRKIKSKSTKKREKAAAELLEE